MKELEMLRTIQALQAKLMVEEEQNAAYAAILAENALYRFDERVREGVMLWLKDELTDDFGVEDITLEEIQEETGVSAFGALCIMDIFIKNEAYVQMATWVERSDSIQ